MEKEALIEIILTMSPSFEIRISLNSVSLHVVSQSIDLVSSNPVTNYFGIEELLFIK